MERAGSATCTAVALHSDESFPAAALSGLVALGVSATLNVAVVVPALDIRVVCGDEKLIDECCQVGRRARIERILNPEQK